MGLREMHLRLARDLDLARREGPEAEYTKFREPLTEALEEGHMKPEDFSIRLLFEALVPDGREIVESWSPQSGGGRSGQQLMEAGDAVKTSDFSDITGQILFSKTMEGYKDPMFLGDRMYETVPTRFSGEKIPGIARLGDVAESIGENQPYPVAGVSQDYIETPETTKRGFIVPVTKEAVFFDRTGQVLNRAREVGYWLGVNKEKRQLDVALGVTDTYNRKGLGTVANYGDDSGNHDWDNLAASNALVDWTDIETAKELFAELTDPNTAEPIMVDMNTIIVPSGLEWTAARIINATSIQHVDNQANADTIRTTSSNPVPRLQILSSQYVSDRVGDQTTWFIGDPRRAFNYMENWPITSVAAPPNNEMEFTHDIIHREKVSERGVATCVEPRRMVKCTA